MKIESSMQSLRLEGMQRMWNTLTESRQYQGLTLPEGLELLLQAEVESRENRRLARLEKAASFRYQASVEELSFSKARGLDKHQLLSLCNGSFIEQGQAVLITGPTGVGKSFLASALGHQACMLGYKVSYFSTSKLLLKLRLARADGSIIKLLEKISKQHLLILDDFGLSALDEAQRMDLMEIIEDRHSRKSILIASQLPLSSWYDVIGESTIADAIIDRLIHGGHRIELSGESMRKKK
jgi:DNA replication protein DnaC